MTQPMETNFDTITPANDNITPANNPVSITDYQNFNIDPYRCMHLKDMSETKTWIPASARRNIFVYQPLSYLYFVIRLIIHLVLTLFFNWTFPLVNPLNFIVTFILFPGLAVVFFFAEIIFRIVNQVRSISKSTNTDTLKLWQSLSKYHVEDNLRKGLDSLNKDVDDSNSPEFNIDRAEFLLWADEAIISRDEGLVDKAYQKIIKLDKLNASAQSREVQEIVKLLDQSEEPVRERAKHFGLKFMSLTECNSVGGPYAGIFWSEDHNFIILSFKGTDALSLTQWLTNFSLHRMDARPYLFGEVHEGFYTSIFPDNTDDSVKFKNQYPAVRLTEAIKTKAAEINGRTQEPVNLWISGHSLGAALASLMHVRIFASPDSVGENVNLRGTYLFACPYVGDNDFAAHYKFLENQPKNATKNLWRIINDSDVVPRLAPGFHSSTLSHYLTKIDLFNFIGIGDEVKFFQDGGEPTSKRNLYIPKPETLIFPNQNFNFPRMISFLGLTETNDRTFLENFKNFFKFRKDEGILPVDRFIPLPFLNHFTYRHFVVMEKARKYWDRDNANVDENMIQNPRNSNPV
ncbi:1022_t:CDS:2 [Acaulospora morrowiae]|uniref:1022_t:CDS:1 n=1 Tax=Acaulospora morrowiae TaxID=94023 RepID=A0A9N8ZYM6_9GLOM|nr:1022_t:CDS:2 [Acaulospora morrowiae]